MHLHSSCRGGPRRLDRFLNKEEHRLTGSVVAPGRNKQATLNREAAYYRAFTLFVPANSEQSNKRGGVRLFLSVRRDQLEIRLASPLHLAGLFAGRLPPYD